MGSSESSHSESSGSQSCYGPKGTEKTLQVQCSGVTEDALRKEARFFGVRVDATPLPCAEGVVTAHVFAGIFTLGIANAIVSSTTGNPDHFYLIFDGAIGGKRIWYLNHFGTWGVYHMVTDDEEKIHKQCDIRKEGSHKTERSRKELKNSLTLEEAITSCNTSDCLKTPYTWNANNCQHYACEIYWRLEGKR